VPRAKKQLNPIALIEPFPPYSHGVVWLAVCRLTLLDWLRLRGGWQG
jgi:hypothetical protein